MAEWRPVYCKYCGQTILSDNLEKCSGCERTGGLADAADPAAVAALVARKAEAPAPSRDAKSKPVPLAFDAPLPPPPPPV